MRSATPQPRRPHAAAYATSLAFGALKGIHEGEVLGEAGHIVQRQVRWRSLGDIVDIFFKIPFKALPFDLDQIVGTDRILRAESNCQRSPTLGRIRHSLPIAFAGPAKLQPSNFHEK